MKTPLKVLRLVQVALVISFLAHPSIASAEVKIGPGESVRGVFTANDQKHEYSVNMGPGERLLLHIQSVGETLFTGFEVFDPGGNRIENRRSAMRIKHDFRSVVLSARGRYLITVSNTKGVGEYTISLGTIASDGREIPPGSH